MSKVGLEYAVFAQATVGSDGTITYGTGKWISPAAAYNSSLNKTNGKDWGDDRVVATENGVTGGTITVEFNHEEDDMHEYLLGHTKATEGNEIVFNENDTAPYVGTGFVGKSRKGRTTYYKAKWYALVQFSDPNDENSSKQDNPNFGHTSLEGEIVIPENGEWKKQETFDTLAAAKAWLNELANITE